MTLPNTPQVNDWNSAYTPQAADFNLYIRDAFSFLASPPRLRAVQGTIQSGLSSGVFTPVTLQTVTEDNYSGWGSSLSTGLTGSFAATANGYQAQQPGWYQVTLTVPLTESAAVYGGVGLSLLNAGSSSGPYLMNESVTGAQPFTFNVFDDVYLAVGDCVFPWVIPTGTTNATSLTFPASFEIVWISL